MKNKLKLFIYNLSAKISKEIRKETEIDFSLYSQGEKIKTISICHKPNIGDVIYKSDSLFNNEDYKFKIELVELSETGYTGKLHGTLLK